MERPTAYIETSVVSYLAAHPSRDPATARNQRLTHAWWATRRHDYALFTSPHVLREASRGNPAMASRRLDLLTPLPLLPISADTRVFARELLRGIPLPSRAEEDALHIAIGAEQRMDYLLTWDRKHIANPRLYARIQAICGAWGFRAPTLCTPAALMEE